MLCYWRFGPSLTAAVAFIFVSAMVVIVFIDLDYMIIPNVITYPGTVIGAVLVAVNQALQMQGSPLISEPFVASLIDSFYGLLAGPGVLLALWWFYRVVRKREGLGLGDVKLLAMIGVTFGPVGAWFTIFVGSVIGSVLGIIQVLARRIGFSQAVPFGPYLVIGFLFFLFDGPGLLARMLNHPEIPLLWWISQQR
jgi:leader peptidase (prepilin peptidase)/N-methyltransferase